MTNIQKADLLKIMDKIQTPKGYAALKKSCLSKVKEWRWADRAMLPEIPFDEFEMTERKPATWQKEKPQRGILHGLDSQGQIHAFRNIDLEVKDEVLWESFSWSETEGIWFASYNFENMDKVPLLHGLIFFETAGDRLLRRRSYHNFNGRVSLHDSTFTWSENRLESISKRSWDGILDDSVADIFKPIPASKITFSSECSDRTETKLSYSKEGKYENAYQELSHGEHGEPYSKQFLVKKKTPAEKKKPRGATLKQLLAEIEEGLVAEIPKRLKKAKPKGIFCLGYLQYSGVDTDPCGFAPPIILVAESTRERILKEEKVGLGCSLWMLGEMECAEGSVWVQAKDKALDAKCDQVFNLTIRDVEENNYGPVRKMFQRVCMRLNNLDWKGILKSTDDFVFVPSEPHGEFDLMEDFKASVPKAKLKLLMERGLLAK